MEVDAGGFLFAFLPLLGAVGGAGIGARSGWRSGGDRRRAPASDRVPARVGAADPKPAGAFASAARLALAGAMAGACMAWAIAWVFTIFLYLPWTIVRTAAAQRSWAPVVVGSAWLLFMASVIGSVGKRIIVGPSPKWPAGSRST